MSATWWRGAVARLAVAAGLWWVLAEGEMSTWPYAVVIVPAVTATSLALLPPRPVAGSPVRRASAVVRLSGCFLWQSLRGGTDVALRSLRRPVDVDPVDLTVELRLRSRRARVLLADISSLTPGSLTVDLDGADLHLHVLHHELQVEPLIRDLEELVAAVFGEEITPVD